MCKYFLFLLFILLAFQIHAQQDTITLDDETIDIVKDYVPVVERANKKHFVPKLPTVEAGNPSTTPYQLPVRYGEITYSPSEIRPLGLRKEEPVSMPIAYLKAGFGNYLTPLVEFRLTNRNSERFRVTASLDHLSSRRKKIENQRFSNTDAKVTGEAYFKGLTLGFEPYYTLDNYHFYGYDQEDTSFTADETRNRYHKGGARLYAFNHEENNLGVDYHAEIAVHGLKDGYNNKEVNFNLETGASKTFREIFTVGGNVFLDAVSLKSVLNDNRFSFGVNPYFEAGKDRWQVRGGMWLLIDEGSVYAMPDIRHQSKLFKDYIVMYNEWIGHLEFNSTRTLSEKNPWLTQTISYNHYRIEARNFVGFKGHIPGGIDYDARFSQLVYYDVPLLVNTVEVFRPFTVNYDDKLKVWNAHVSLGYHLADFLSIRAGMDYFNYNPEDEARAWHMPTVKGNFAATYHFDNKLILKADIFFFGPSQALETNGNRTKLKGTADINFSASYHLNDHVGFFAQVNNVASIKHRRYNNYPGYGFLGMGGVILSY